MFLPVTDSFALTSPLPLLCLQKSLAHFHAEEQDGFAS